MIAPFALAAVALATAARIAPAQALGTPPPEFIAVKWYNSPPLTLEELRGKAVFVEVFRTWNEASNAKVSELNAKSEKEAAKGLVVIGVTDEQTPVVDAWVKLKKPAYPIVILAHREFEGALGVRDFPTDAVIAPDGNLIYAGYAPESKLAEALSKAKKGSIWPKKLEKVAESIRAQEYDKAYGDLVKSIAAGLDAGEAPKAEKLKAYLERCSIDAVAEGRELLEQGRIYEASSRIERFAAAATPFPNAEEAKKLLSDLRAVPGFKEEMKGGEMFVVAQDLEAARSYIDAIEGYRAVIKKYGSTKVASAARERAEDLIRRGMPGYDATCGTCVRENKACEQHAKKVKL